MSAIFVILVAALLVWFAFIYNRLIIARNSVMVGWNDLDLQLTRRHELIPQLVETINRYVPHENAAIRAVTALSGESRALQDVGKKQDLEIELGKRMNQLIASADDYPDLKASQSFLDLQYSHSEVEKNIRHARSYYNGAVSKLNIRVKSFPDLLIAGFFGFTEAQYFDFDETS